MPASYPGSVKTFTAKNTGDTVEASHITDLQDEVTAIEAGIRNGTAPLNSSNSTMTNLVITGNFQSNNNVQAQTLGVSGLSTLGGVTVTGASIFANTWTLSAIMAAASLSTGNTDNLAVASTLVVVQASANSSGSTLTGLAYAGGASHGLMLLLRNPSGNPLVLGHATGSASTGQFRCPGNTALTVRAQGAVWLYYDDQTAHAWMVVGV